MGVEYMLVSDARRDMYDLGKGYHWWDSQDLIRGGDPVALAARLAAAPGWTSEYAEDVASQILAYVSERPDWRMISDADIPDECAALSYREAGTRYRKCD